MKRGFLYGETAPERPCLVTDKPEEISVTDLHATILHRNGHLAEDGLRRREAAVLCDARRQRAAGQGVVCNGAGIASCRVALLAQ